MENLVPFLNAGSPEALVGMLELIDDGELEKITVAFHELASCRHHRRPRGW